MKRFFDMAGSSDKTLKLYDGYFHDLLNDVGREAVCRISSAGSMRAWRQASRGRNRDASSE